MKRWLRRGELAKILGIPVPTVKYYTLLGLFYAGRKTENGQFLYDLEETRERSVQIKEYKENRLTIREIIDRLQDESAGNKMNFQNDGLLGQG